jgi:hypothetical protein
MRKNRALKKTMLIVCEGENSEPSYFKGLAALSREMGVFSFVEIFPRPKPTEEEQAALQQQKATGRPQRQLAAGRQPVPERIVEPADVDELPFMTVRDGKEVWPTPVRYIKEARDRMKEVDYDEVWAVFDKDGHAQPAAAYQLAAIPIDEKIVQVAFSSIAFEHWLLLHYERNATAFSKSECKEPRNGQDKPDPLGCGRGAHADDCWGANCVIGLLRTNAHIQDYDKSGSNDIFLDTFPYLPAALINAVWLRKQHGVEPTSVDVHEKNPVTTIDLLVKQILDDRKEIHFITFGEQIVLNEVLILEAAKVADQLTLSLQAIGGAAIHTNELNVSFNLLAQNVLPISMPHVIRDDPFQSTVDIPANAEAYAVNFREHLIFISEI